MDQMNKKKYSRGMFEFSSKRFEYTSLVQIAEENGFSLDELPISIKVLMENVARRSSDGRITQVKKASRTILLAY